MRTTSLQRCIFCFREGENPRDGIQMFFFFSYTSNIYILFSQEQKYPPDMRPPTSVILAFFWDGLCPALLISYFILSGRKEKVSRKKGYLQSYFPGQEKKQNKNMNMLTRPYRTPRLSTPRGCSIAADRRCRWCRISDHAQEVVRVGIIAAGGEGVCGGMEASYSVKVQGSWETRDYLSVM